MRRARRLLDLPFCAALAACGSNSTSALSPPAIDAAPPASPDWPAYGRDHDNSRANPAEHAIAKSNVMTLEPRWAFSESAVTSTACVLGGVAYFGDWNSVLHAVDARSGETIWATPLQPATAPNQANDSPNVTEDAVYIGAHGALLSAVDRKAGSLLWQQKIDEQASLMLWSSPVIIDDLIVTVSARTRFSCRPRRFSRQRGGGGREIGHGEMASLPHGGKRRIDLVFGAIDKAQAAFIGTGQGIHKALDAELGRARCHPLRDRRARMVATIYDG
jgi:hypothetical protein